MKSLKEAVGAVTSSPIIAVGNVLDELFTSEDEKLDKELLKQRLAQAPHLAQAEINKLEAQHRSIFVAGWRPFIGWVCGIGLAYTFLINPLIQWYTGVPGPQLQTDVLSTLTISLLGLGGLRTLEKVVGRAK